jgi:protein-tyrosine phosphatase
MTAPSLSPVPQVQIVTPPPSRSSVNPSATISNGNVNSNVIPNFRHVTFSKNLYRSPAPEDHISLDGQDQLKKSISRDGDCNGNAETQPRQQLLLTESELFVYNDVTLWIDLRFKSEINNTKLWKILDNAPGGRFEQLSIGCDSEGDSNSTKEVLDVIASASGASGLGQQRRRFYLHSQGLSHEGMMKYAAKHWISSDEMRQVAHAAGSSNNKSQQQQQNQKALLLNAIRQHGGLAGLFKIILDYGDFIKHTLQAITVHLEHNNNENNNGKVLIHCSLGKDRTGVVCMLCQSMLGATDEQIIVDFTKSQAVADIAAEKLKPHFGDVDAADISFLCGATPETMKETLSFLRQTYGSVDGYLDSVGFNAVWRRRFVAVA